MFPMLFHPSFVLLCVSCSRRLRRRKLARDLVVLLRSTSKAMIIHLARIFLEFALPPHQCPAWLAVAYYLFRVKTPMAEMPWKICQDTANDTWSPATTRAFREA
jgi:hypothetical protein